MNKKLKKAVLLLSGGIDSTTMLAFATKKGYSITALSFDYGQKNLFELTAARKIARIYECHKHIIFEINLAAWGASSLTDENIKIEKNRSLQQISSHIPATYVPARNAVFLTIALSLAEAYNIDNIFIGVNHIDYSGYPDCRPQFIKSWQKMANLATKTEQKIILKTPLINMSKAEIIKLGAKLGVNYALTFTCYDPSDKGEACNSCDACLLRKQGFEQAKTSDPAQAIKLKWGKRSSPRLNPEKSAKKPILHKEAK